MEKRLSVLENREGGNQIPSYATVASRMPSKPGDRIVLRFTGWPSYTKDDIIIDELRDAIRPLAAFNRICKEQGTKDIFTKKRRAFDGYIKLWEGATESHMWECINGFNDAAVKTPTAKKTLRCAKESTHTQRLAFAAFKNAESAALKCI
eukprot:2268389-Karenia_brevis.AAC.1